MKKDHHGWLRKSGCNMCKFILYLRLHSRRQNPPSVACQSFRCFCTKSSCQIRLAKKFELPRIFQLVEWIENPFRLSLAIPRPSSMTAAVIALNLRVTNLCFSIVYCLERQDYSYVIRNSSFSDEGCVSRNRLDSQISILGTTKKHNIYKADTLHKLPRRFQAKYNDAISTR